MLIKLYQSWRRRKKLPAVISAEVSNRLVERLAYVKLQPKIIVSIGRNIDYLTQLLAKRYPEAQIIAIEQNSMSLDYRDKLQIQHKNGQVLPLFIEAGSTDLVVVNLNNLESNNQLISALFNELQRILKPNGLLLFVCFGPDTLKELRSYANLPNLMDMHDIGDLLLNAGWQDPVMEMEMLVVNYSQYDQFASELAALKLSNDLLINEIAMPLSVTFEIIYGHAWQASKYKPLQANNGEIHIPINQIKKLK